MDRLKSCSIAIIGMLVVTCAARANDSAAELSIGGLQFVRTNDIAMQSEDLRISLDRVAVRYQFANTAKFQIDQRAMVGDKDVTAQLDQFKLPLLPIGSREIRVARSNPHQARGSGLVDACENRRQRPPAICCGLGRENIRSSPADISARAWGHRRAPVQAERVARWRPLSAAAALKDRLVQSQRIDLALDVAEGGPIEEAFIGIDPQDLAQGYFGGGASLVGR